MTTILRTVWAISHKSAATGSRRCSEASKEGWRWAGNLLELVGLGGGERKGWVGNSWKWMLVVSRGFRVVAWTLAWRMWVVEPTKWTGRL